MQKTGIDTKFKKQVLDFLTLPEISEEMAELSLKRKLPEDPEAKAACALVSLLNHLQINSALVTNIGKSSPATLMGIKSLHCRCVRYTVSVIKHERDDLAGKLLSILGKKINTILIALHERFQVGFSLEKLYKAPGTIRFNQGDSATQVNIQVCVLSFEINVFPVPYSDFLYPVIKNDTGMFDETRILLCKGISFYLRQLSTYKQGDSKDAFNAQSHNNHPPFITHPLDNSIVTVEFTHDFELC